MTMHYDNFHPFSGGPNGRYRTALAPSSGSPVDASSSANLGAVSSLSRARQTPALENAGIRTGEIIAYRAWLLDDDGLLRGMFVDDYIWRPGAIEHSPTVHPTWGAGLHAFKTLKQAKRHYSCYSLTRCGVVFGEVALWGEVIEHEIGYRAEYAAICRIDAIWRGLSHTSWSWKFWKPQPLRALRRRYGLTRRGLSVSRPTQNSEAK